MGLKEFRKKLKWADPFTYIDIFVMPKVNPNENEAISWVVYLASAFFFAWAIYTGLGILLGTQNPMMIVVSASMEPLYHRGDIIVLQGATEENLAGQEVQLDYPSLSGTAFASIASPVYRPGTNRIESIEFNSGQKIPITKEGSIVVYWSEYRQEPIVHRVVAKLNAGDGLYLLTKGDAENNASIDQDCGILINGKPKSNNKCIELYPVPLENLQGKTLFHLPLLGCVKLWLLDDLRSLWLQGKMPKEYQEGNIC